ncbi:MAG TPA: CdaR family protein [Candidatus Kapabacteria bacterium]|nr:CdaR family protein [Candidatus Kapabacteria bacterium]
MGLARRIGILTAAIFFAVLLWAYVHLSGTYEVETDLPLAVATPTGYAVSSDLPSKVHARLSGPGWRMIMLGSARSSKLKIDLSERDPKDLLGKIYITKEELAASSSLPSDVKLVKMEPDSLMVQLSRETSRRVPVELRMDVIPSSGYMMIGDPVITPALITIHGSNSVTDSVMSFPTKLLRSHGAHESFTQTIELSDTLGDLLTSRSVNTVAVHVVIEAIAEQTFKDIPVTVEALPADRELFLDPSTVTLTLRGGVDELAKLTPQMIKAKVTYDAMKFDSLQSVVPQIEVPKGFDVLQSQPVGLRFVVRKK